MASTGEVWKLGHRPALDGVRGIAVLLVVVTHVGIPHLRAAGVVGVTVFFTLSGFLITTLLLEERETSGRVSFVNFYRRRALRLLPAMLVMVGIVGGLFVLAGHSLAWMVGESVPVVFYYGNWVRASGDYLGMWSHTWSLAVEEQFYLLWPLALVGLARLGRNAVMVAAVAGSIYAVAARAALWNDGAGLERVYYGSDTHADALLLGALLAVLMRGRRDGAARPGVAAALMLGIAAWSVAGNGAGIFVVGQTVVPLLTVATLFCVARGGGVGWLEWRPLVVAGQRSYGLYLWHYPVTYLLTFVAGPWAPAAVVGVVALSWGLTCLSWRYVEQPFLRLKDRRSASRVEAAGRVLVGSDH